MATRAKCSTSGYCDPLLERLGENNRTSKGFAALTLINEEGDITVTTPAYYLGGKDVGVFINYCPWCGVKMAPIMKAWSRKPVERFSSK